MKRTIAAVLLLVAALGCSRRSELSTPLREFKASAAWHDDRGRDLNAAYWVFRIATSGELCFARTSEDPGALATGDVSVEHYAIGQNGVRSITKADWDNAAPVSRGVPLLGPSGHVLETSKQGGVPYMGHRYTLSGAYVGGEVMGASSPDYGRVAFISYSGHHKPWTRLLFWRHDPDAPQEVPAGEAYVDVFDMRSQAKIAGGRLASTGVTYADWVADRYLFLALREGAIVVGDFGAAAH